jgi:hypothetical protein
MGEDIKKKENASWKDAFSLIHHDRKLGDKIKGEIHPRTGHEGPEGQ